jgi:hypothetical protein
MFDYDIYAAIALVAIYGGTPILALPTSDDGHLGAPLIFHRSR